MQVGSHSCAQPLQQPPRTRVWGHSHVQPCRRCSWSTHRRVRAHTHTHVSHVSVLHWGSAGGSGGPTGPGPICRPPGPASPARGLQMGRGQTPAKWPGVGGCSCCISKPPAGANAAAPPRGRHRALTPARSRTRARGHLRPCLMRWGPSRCCRVLVAMVAVGVSSTAADRGRGSRVPPWG